MTLVFFVILYVFALVLIMVINAYFLRWVFRINHLAKSAEKASLFMQLMARKMGMTDEELQEIEEHVGRKY